MAEGVPLPRRRAPLGALVAFALLASGCTTTTIRPQLTTRPTQAYHTVYVGEIGVANDIWRARVAHFREGLIGKLREGDSFLNVSDSVPETLPPAAIRVSGTVTEVDKGDKALRFLIGFGAGRARVEGTFEIADESGVLARFSSAKAYSGGAGIGGIDMMNMDELMAELGEATAESIIRWSRGETLEPPAAED